MQLINEHTKKFESVAVGDTLYTWEEMTPRHWERQKTWTFMCEGFVVYKGHNHVIGPGGHLYELGITCFTTDNECRDVKCAMDKSGKDKLDKYKLALVRVKEEEKVRI